MKRIIAIGLVGGCIIGGASWWHFWYGNNTTKASLPVVTAIAKVQPTNQKNVKDVVSQTAKTEAQAKSESRKSRKQEISALEPWIQIAKGKKLLTGKEIEDVCAFLKDNQSSASIGLLAAIKNNIMNRLGASVEAKETFLKTLEHILSDSKQPIVMRDYAAQHMLTWSDTFKEDARIAASYWQFVDVNEGSLGGTVILCLEKLHRMQRLSEEDGKRLTEKSQEVAQSQSRVDAARMSALMHLSNENAANATDIARGILENNRSVPLALTALNTLGKCGDKNDASLIENNGFLKDPKFQSAAQAALTQINNRNTEN